MVQNWKKFNQFCDLQNAISSSVSSEGAVDAIVASIDPLFTVLIEDSTSDPTAKGILKFVTTFSFLATTYLLADILPVLARQRQRWLLFKKTSVQD